MYTYVCIWDEQINNENVGLFQIHAIRKEYTNHDKKLVATAKQPFKRCGCHLSNVYVYVCKWDYVKKSHLQKNRNLLTHRKETIQLKTQWTVFQGGEKLQNQ